MKKSYQISKEGIYQSLKYLRIHFYVLPATMLIAIPFAHYIKGKDWEFSITFGPPIMIGVFLLIDVIPTAIVHLSHFLANRNLKVTVNNDNKVVAFQFLKSHQEFNYRFDQLRVIRYLTLYQQNKNRLSTGWSNYSYLRFITEDNKEFNISSTVMTSDQISIEATQTRYIFWPSMNASYRDNYPDIGKQEQDRQLQLDNWKKKFSDLTYEQIKSRLEDPDKFDKLPRMALEELLEEKNATNSVQ
ncbi:hypothetical protein OKW21_001600 [Catalinimonas alkaloidigena]|uniref:hypothetical protein n=1 Tax=Catalinimonas alkaloidigena TaxID=1075417 RepID=UPI002406D944|nr:hypothetical protein [Catalinimonas alkaloidigena]MDF9796337.1 hypothetical protein [Catalinimonas alkaloidigena]